MEPDVYYERLLGLGWFDGCPASAIQSAKKTIAGNISDEGFRSICAESPGMAMASIWGDAECIYDDESYSALIRLFAKGSHGLFRPKNIQESWPDDPDGFIELAFEVGKTRYSTELEHTGTDYLDWDFLKLINSALAARKAPLQFVVPKDLGGQDFLAPAHSRGTPGDPYQGRNTAGGFDF